MRAEGNNNEQKLMKKNTTESKKSKNRFFKRISENELESPFCLETEQYAFIIRSQKKSLGNKEIF